MCTLIEIFDAKQYENIITPINLDIKKVIYVGTKEVMTDGKIRDIHRFFDRINHKVSLEFYYVERDNEQSIENRLTQIVKNNPDAVFDATGGEDVILTSVGVISERFSVPVIRTDVKTKKHIPVHGKPVNIAPKSIPLGIFDLITLQGGQVISSDNIDSFTDEDVATLKSVFEVNSHNPEAFIAMCGAVSEFLSADGKTLLINKELFEKNATRSRRDIYPVFNLLTEKNLITKIDEDEKTVTYKTKSHIVSMCLKKSGNALEYYTAIAMAEINGLTDIKVGVQIEWESGKKYFETQNEIDVMAVSSSLPVFVSCKNGEVRKEALYELDSVSRALGGTYAKKILVCTYLSKNASSRERILERARDMGIEVIFNTHTKPFERFIYYLNRTTS